MLLSDIEKLSLVSNLLDLFAWISVTIGHGVGFQTHDLLSLIDIVLELTSSMFKLLTLHPLLTDLLLELLFGLVNVLDPLLSILLELLDLILKTLLVFLIFLLMLTLDDLLSLFGDSIELNILGSFLEVLDLKIESLLLESNLFETSLERTDGVHELDFLVSSMNDFVILISDNILGDQDSILVISGYRKLRYLNETLFKVNNNLVVVSNLHDSFSSLLLGKVLSFILLIKVSQLILEVVDVLLELSNLVLLLRFLLVHFGSDLPFLDKFFEVILV